jgi:hypothetical protein
VEVKLHALLSSALDGVEMHGHFQAPVALSLVRPPPRGHSRVVRGVGPKAGVDVAAQTETSVSARSQTPVIQPIAAHYTDSAILDPQLHINHFSKLQFSFFKVQY